MPAILLSAVPLHAPAALAAGPANQLFSPYSRSLSPSPRLQGSPRPLHSMAAGATAPPETVSGRSVQPLLFSGSCPGSRRGGTLQVWLLPFQLPSQKILSLCHRWSLGFYTRFLSQQDLLPNFHTLLLVEYKQLPRPVLWLQCIPSVRLSACSCFSSYSTGTYTRQDVIVTSVV